MCSKPMYPGHGMTYARNDAKVPCLFLFLTHVQVFHLCSRKCRKLFEKKANPRRIRWTKSYRKTHNKELAMDTTFDFEKVRNRPPKYDRELYAQTIQAMKRVAEIQYRRQRAFYLRRMKESLKKRKMHIARQIVKNKDLIIAPVAQKKKALMSALPTTQTRQDTFKLDLGMPNKKQKQQQDDDQVMVDENDD